MASPGDVLRGRYRLTRLVSSGTNASVHQAEDMSLGRVVTVKILTGSRFDAEARVLAGLDHAALVKVYDAGEHDGDAFLVLEQAEGVALDELLAGEGPLDPGQAAELGRALAGGLAALHGAHLVHGDVTPDHVLVDASGRPRLTLAGATLAGDAADDVRALGIVLLGALTGKAGEGVPDDLPRPWPGLLATMLDPDPTRRPAAAEVEAVLDEEAPVTAGVVPWATATQAVARPAEPVTTQMAVPAPWGADETAPPPRRRRRWLLAVPFLAALALVAAVLAFSSLEDPEPLPAGDADLLPNELPTTTTAATVPVTAPPPPPPTEPPTTTAPPPTAPPTTEATEPPTTQIDDTKPGQGGGGGPG